MAIGGKRGASFGTIVAVFGTVLIALGFAWLIAQNWHQFANGVKIAILFAVIAVSFLSGGFFSRKGHAGIGKSLYALGGLFHTLTVFLIAQIYHFDVSIQGIAFLFLLSWLGVLLSAYILRSWPNLVIALVEFLVWLVVQFLAFSDFYRMKAAPGILAFYFLFSGLLFYGLYLIHKARGHPFSTAYQFWTVFYILAFGYFLSFQTLLPHYWPADAERSAPALALLSLLGAASVISVVFGVRAGLTKKFLHKKEIVGVVITVVVLGFLIALTAATSNKVGGCSTKTCFGRENKQECENGLPPISENGCIWERQRCIDERSSCSSIENKTKCEKSARPKCFWIGDYCQAEDCRKYYQSEQECNNSSLSCVWENGGCQEMQCYRFTTESECEKDSNAIRCSWEHQSCDSYDPCSEFDNQYGQCNAESSCQWNSGYYRRDSKPLILWVVWIFINVAFIAIILGIIAYGTWQKTPRIINLGIAFFALDIVTRYIGFIEDLWGYTSLAIIFITGGILLVFGGWGIEKWRRKLVKKAA
ncbi:DUF2157 domain-containing protein [Candidatus Woesearchaeota archaeon]|nr:DUF2157 domain-containing protein [Candidatus Woesearchaeota archaeon]